MEFKQKLQKLKELASIYQIRFVEKTKLLNTLSSDQLDQMEKIKKETMENELYSVIANNAVQYFIQTGGRKTRKKVKFAKKKNIVFIE